MVEAMVMATAVVTSSETRSITLTLIVAVQSSSMLALTIADANSTADSCHVDKIEETTARSPQKFCVSSSRSTTRF